MKNKESILAVFALLILIAGIGGIVLISNMDNTQVPAGYAGYQVHKPFFGKSKFEKVVLGQASTGWMWRREVPLVAITPYSVDANMSGIQAKDNLAINTTASITFQIPREEEAVQTFFEKFGGWDVKTDPDVLVKDAYNQFIKRRFEMEIRNAIAQFNALDIKSNLPAIQEIVLDRIRSQMNEAKAPFAINNIVISQAAPPETVITEINMKVAESQKLERKLVELNVAKKEEEIQEAQGRAEARRAEQVALGEKAKAKAQAEADLFRRQQLAQGKLVEAEAEAKGIALLAESRKKMNDATGENIIRYEMTQKLPEIKFPHIYVGEGILDNIYRAVKQLHPADAILNNP